MKRQNVLKVLFYSLVLSSMASCGLIEKWKSPEQPTDSKTSENATSESDDLFSKTMSESTAAENSDAPQNITSENEAPKDDLKSLEDEFAIKSEKIAETSEIKEVKVEESMPVIKEEMPVATNELSNEDAGSVKSYQVQKGETLMQIAFKIYGDISKWKSIKNMNNGKLSSNSALRPGMELKYTAPKKQFVWNPEGNPHMIKNGETLGTISNTAYQTPKKWKSIWDNNKPLIKNPNVIFAGFTLFIKGSGMANYVQPKAAQKNMAVREEATEIETVSVEKALSHEAAMDKTSEIQSAPKRQSDEINLEEIKEELKEELKGNLEETTF